MKLRTKILAIASILPVMANAYYVESVTYTTPIVTPVPVYNYVQACPVQQPVVSACPTQNYAPTPVYNNVPVSNYNTQQYYTPVVQTTVGYYQ